MEKTNEIKEQVEVMDEVFEDCRTLVITGEFDESLIGEVYEFVNQLVYYEDMEEQPGITVMLSSPGGSATVLFTVADILLGTGLHITTMVNGYAYSSAFGLFCLGDERIVQPFSELMYHTVSYPMERANVVEHKSAIKDAGRVQEKYDNMVKMKTKVTQKMLNKYKGKDWWITPEEAKELGIATN